MTKREKAAYAKKHICPGCHYNYYNHPTPGDGWDVAVPEGYECWHVEKIEYNRAKKQYECGLYHR